MYVIFSSLKKGNSTGMWTQNQRSAVDSLMPQVVEHKAATNALLPLTAEMACLDAGCYKQKLVNLKLISA